MSAKRVFFGVLQKIMVICCTMFFGFTNAFSANLPSGYTELEYIESTGTQYINTGVKYSSSTQTAKYDLDFQIVKFNSDGGGLWGVLEEKRSGCLWYKGNAKNNEFAMSISGTASAGTSIVIPSDKNRHNVIFEAGLTAQNNTVNINYDNTSYTGSYIYDYDMLGVGEDIFLFYGYGAYRYSYGPTAMKVYNFKIYLDNTLVRNLVPAKNSSGVVGMYDTVSGTFFTNAGTGTFDAGPVVATNSGAISSVTVAGLVAQNGTPTPTTPIDIVSNNGVLKVSKNLFTTDGSTNGYYLNATATPTSYSENFAYSALIPVLPNTAYTLSGVSGMGATNRRLHAYDSSGTWIEQIGVTNGYTVLGQPYTIQGTMPANTAYVRVSYATEDTNVQLEQGSTATPYMPYGEIYTDGEVETIADSANHAAKVATLLGVGDYRDTQNINTGAITRRVGVKVLDGTENWQKGSITFYIDNLITDVNSSDDYLPYCSHYQGVYNGGVDYPGENKIKLGFYSGGFQNRTLLYDSRVSSLTLEQFKQWLADQYANGTPVMIVYPLATETTESVTGQTMTTAPVDNRTGGVTGMTITTLLSSGTSVVTTIAANAIKIATTAYNSARFSPVVNDLNTTIATIREIVTKTINQTAAIASLQADKQTRPEDACPVGKKCLLVETEENGVIVPHWFPIIETPEDN